MVRRTKESSELKKESLSEKIKRLYSRKVKKLEREIREQKQSEESSALKKESLSEKIKRLYPRKLKKLEREIREQKQSDSWASVLKLLKKYVDFYNSLSLLEQGRFRFRDDSSLPVLVGIKNGRMGKLKDELDLLMQSDAFRQFFISARDARNIDHSLENNLHNLLIQFQKDCAAWCEASLPIATLENKEAILLWEKEMLTRGGLLKKQYDALKQQFEQSISDRKAALLEYLRRLEQKYAQVPECIIDPGHKLKDRLNTCKSFLEDRGGNIQADSVVAELALLKKTIKKRVRVAIDIRSHHIVKLDATIRAQEKTVKYIIRKYEGKNTKLHSHQVADAIQRYKSEFSSTIYSEETRILCSDIKQIKGEALERVTMEEIQSYRSRYTVSKADIQRLQNPSRHQLDYICGCVKATYSLMPLDIRRLERDFEKLQSYLKKLEDLFMGEYCDNKISVREAQYKALMHFHKTVEDFEKQISELEETFDNKVRLMNYPEFSGKVVSLRKKISAAAREHGRPLYHALTNERMLRNNKRRLLEDIKETIETKYPGVIAYANGKQTPSCFLSCGLFQKHYLSWKKAPTGVRAIAKLFAYEGSSEIHSLNHNQLNILLSQILNIACDRLMVDQSDPKLLTTASQGLIVRKNGTGELAYQVNQNWLEVFHDHPSWEGATSSNRRLVVNYGLDREDGRPGKEIPGIKEIKKGMKDVSNAHAKHRVFGGRSNEVHGLYKRIASHTALTLCDALRLESIYGYETEAHREFMQITYDDHLPMPGAGESILG